MRIVIDKIPPGKNWSKVLFTKGIYSLLPSEDKAIEMRAGGHTNAKTYITKGFILEITELEEWVEFRSNKDFAYFYRFDLNNLGDFIVAVEGYKDDLDKFENHVNTQMQPTIDGHTQELATLDGAVTNLDLSLKQLDVWRNSVDATLNNLEARVVALEGRP